MKIQSLTRIALPTFAMVPLLFAYESKLETRPTAKQDEKSEPRAERVDDRK